MTTYAPNNIYCCDAFELLRGLEAESIDALITDPPYGIGLDMWDKAIDIPAFLIEVERVLKTGGFFAFTVQMPVMAKWLIALESSGLRFKDHVVWLKRNVGGYGAGLLHCHESLLIYTKGSAAYFQTEGKYTDVKLPGILFDAITIDGLQRYISDLWQQVQTGKPSKSTSSSKHPSHALKQRGARQLRAPYLANFTTVWSFLPENQKNRTVKSGYVNHASVKPLLMFERLIQLVTAPDALVADPFSGSGTTCLAARNTGRRYISCDLNPDYVAMANERLSAPFTADMFAQQESEAANGTH